MIEKSYYQIIICSFINIRLITKYMPNTLLHKHYLLTSNLFYQITMGSMNFC